MRSSIQDRTVRRRSLRVAAAALTAAAALSLTACSGSDTAGAKSAGPADTGRTAAESTIGAGSPAEAQGGNSPEDPGAKPNAAGNAKAGVAGKQSGSAHTGAAKAASPVRTQTLADGSKAEIYRIGAQRYRAKIVSRGSVLATLETTGQDADAGLDANDMFVVLTMGGEVHSWMGGGRQGPGTFKLAGGWTAKVTKVGELRYRAQIIGNEGSVDATLETNGHDAGVDANGVYIVLSNGGIISAHE
ncbi:hypothetical protein ADL22_00120 [Streptomyces sp. NRRL F-4489]|uniref:hypothetical protein n=1 Tax=Streptomyces sp. NRRL F-4489 TaxID=1609095 RepID=UPI000748F917|nr:hypothetical protein [Streptomyces sp. NRRL F-4489]KUL55345.1 hypothetical protein ADL22_00120 [Streptomyces sp. NRRL F-4489]